MFPPAPLPEDVDDRAPGSPAARRVAAGTGRGELVHALVEPEGSTIVIVPDAARAAVVAELRDEGRHTSWLRATQPAPSERRPGTRRGAARASSSGGGSRSSPRCPTSGDRRARRRRRGAEGGARPGVARAAVASSAPGARGPVPLVSPAPTVEAGRGRTRCSSAPGFERAGWPRLEVVDLRDEPPGAACSRPRSPARAGGLEQVRARMRPQPEGSGPAARVRALRGSRSAGCGARSPRRNRVACARCGVTRPRSACAVTARASARAGPASPSPRQLRRCCRASSSRRSTPPRRGAATPTSASAPRRCSTVRRRRASVGWSPSSTSIRSSSRPATAPRSRRCGCSSERLVSSVDRAGPSVLVQTRVPDHEVVAAARVADVAIWPAPSSRGRLLGFPPFGGLAESAGDQRP